MSSYRGFGHSITIKHLPFLESPFRVRNIATSKWLATSTARMKMANMRANQDLGNMRDFGESVESKASSVKRKAWSFEK